MSQPIPCSSMPSREVFVQEVDKLLALPKTLAGVDDVRWQEGRNEDEQVIKVPLEVSGEVLGPELRVVAFLEQPGKFSVSILHVTAICRLDVVPPDEYHSNPLATPGESHAAKVLGPHFHRWELNRSRIESPVTKLQRLRIAEHYAGPTKFMSALRWFCGETKIMVPHSVAWELPKREGLFAA
jgi:hypothetical protein